MFKIFKDRNLLLYRPDGIMSTEVILAYIQGVLTHQDFQPGLIEFIDLGAVSEWRLSISEVEKITQFDNVDMTPIKRIIKTGIYAPTDVAYGMARMYQSLAERYHAHIFISKHLEETLQYLGLSDAVYRKLTGTPG